MAKAKRTYRIIFKKTAADIDGHKRRPIDCDFYERSRYRGMLNVYWGDWFGCFPISEISKIEYIKQTSPALQAAPAQH